VKDKIRIVLCCIFLTIAVYAGYNIIKIQSEYKKGVDIYKEIDKYTIEQTVAQSSDNTEETVEATEEEKPYPKVDFAGLKAVNGENLQGQQEKAPKLLAQKRNQLLPGIRFVSGKQVSSMDDKKEGNGEGAKILKGGAETAGKGAVDQHHKETGDCLAGIRKVVAQG